MDKRDGVDLRIARALIIKCMQALGTLHGEMERATKPDGCANIRYKLVVGTQA